MNCLAALASVLSLATARLPLLAIYGISGSDESNNTFKIYWYISIFMEVSISWLSKNHVQCFGFEDEGRRISYFIYHPDIKYWKVFA